MEWNVEYGMKWNMEYGMESRAAASREWRNDFPKNIIYSIIITSSHGEFYPRRP